MEFARRLAVRIGTRAAGPPHANGDWGGGPTTSANSPDGQEQAARRLSRRAAPHISCVLPIRLPAGSPPPGADRDRPTSPRRSRDPSVDPPRVPSPLPARPLPLRRGSPRGSLPTLHAPPRSAPWTQPPQPRQLRPPLPRPFGRAARARDGECPAAPGIDRLGRELRAHLACLSSRLRVRLLAGLSLPASSRQVGRSSEKCTHAFFLCEHVLCDR